MNISCLVLLKIDYMIFYERVLVCESEIDKYGVVALPVRESTKTTHR